MERVRLIRRDARPGDRRPKERRPRAPREAQGASTAPLPPKAPLPGTPPPAADANGKPYVTIPPEVLMRAMQRGPQARVNTLEPRKAGLQDFGIPEHPPGVKIPKDVKMAHDTALEANIGWVSSQYSGAYAAVPFLGYTYLAELAQRPEYRVLSEVIATEMTRKWIKIEVAGGDDDLSDDIEQLNEEMERLNIKAAFREIAEHDGFFGRAHLYMDFGTTDNPGELRKPIGDGSNRISQAKIKKGSLERVKVVEPVWTYPLNYNSNNPLRPDWYRPSEWVVMATPIHSSRLLTFVGREVPDLLKPAYSFGGLSMSQMAEPYVNNWLRTRQAVSDLVHTFSTAGVKTNLASILQAGGDDIFRRVDLWNAIRDNRGLLMLDKDTEEFFNVSTPLSSLDLLQAQSQEHMAAISRIPIVKLLGIQPAGLNASSEGEMETFADWINAYQVHLFDFNLKRVLGFVQLSLWGKVNPKITYAWEPLRDSDEKSLAEQRKVEAETDMIYVDGGVIDAGEVRTRLAGQANSPYHGLDPDDLPEIETPDDDDGIGPNEDDPDADQSEKDNADEANAEDAQYVPPRRGTAEAQATEQTRGNLRNDPALLKEYNSLNTGLGGSRVKAGVYTDGELRARIARLKANDDIGALNANSAIPRVRRANDGTGSTSRNVGTQHCSKSGRPGDTPMCGNSRAIMVQSHEAFAAMPAETRCARCNSKFEARMAKRAAKGA